MCFVELLSGAKSGRNGDGRRWAERREEANGPALQEGFVVRVLGKKKKLLVP